MMINLDKRTAAKFVLTRDLFAVANIVYIESIDSVVKRTNPHSGFFYAMRKRDLSVRLSVTFVHVHYPDG